MSLISSSAKLYQDLMNITDNIMGSEWTFQGSNILHDLLLNGLDRSFAKTLVKYSRKLLFSSGKRNISRKCCFKGQRMFLDGDEKNENGIACHKLCRQPFHFLFTTLPYGCWFFSWGRQQTSRMGWPVTSKREKFVLYPYHAIIVRENAQFRKSRVQPYNYHRAMV